MRERPPTRTGGSTVPTTVAPHRQAQRSGDGHSTPSADCDTYRVAVDQAPVGIFLVDRAGTIQFANPAGAGIFGYSDHELIGAPVERLVPDDKVTDHAGLREAYEDELSSRRMGCGRDLIGRRRDGSPVEIEVGLNPYITADGQRITVSTVVDITERRRNERVLEDSRAELRWTNRELVQRNDDLEQFTYAAAHDIRQPLRAIESVLDWVLEDDGATLAERTAVRIGQARQRAARLSRLLSDLLEYAKSASRTPTISHVDFPDLVDEIVSSLDVPPGFDVRYAGGAAALETDRTAVALVLRNLIGNAIKHRDSPTGSVEIRVEVEDGEALIEVEDDGPGIAPRYRAKVFELFSTLRPRDEVEGSGMGLALVKRLVEGQGGTVAIEDGSPRGTLFRIRWPA